MLRVPVSAGFCLATVVQAYGNVDHRDSIEAHIAPAFQASVKNEYGRIGVKQASAVVQRHLASQHGWHVPLHSELLGAAVNQLASGARGLSASNVVDAVLAVEQSIASDLRSSVLEAYGSQSASTVTAAEVESILVAYFSARRTRATALDAQQLATELRLQFDMTEGSLESYSAEDVVSMLQRNLATTSHGRELCEADAECVLSSSTHSTCCVSKCDAIMSDFELKFQAPVVSPERLFAAATSVRAVPPQLQAKLSSIAMTSGGVLLHSQEFAEWMQYAFPAECGSEASLEQIKGYVGEAAWEASHTSVIQDLFTYATELWTQYDTYIKDLLADVAERAGKIPRQEISRTVVFALLGLAMIRIVLAQFAVSSNTLRGEDETQKKPGTKNCN